MLPKYPRITKSTHTHTHTLQNKLKQLQYTWFLFDRASSIR